MSYSNNYSITTLSSSIYQRTLKGGAVVAPFVHYARLASQEQFWVA